VPTTTTTVTKPQALVLLTAVTVLWGTQHAVIKLAIEVLF
jgi:hypothetical protein